MKNVRTLIALGTVSLAANAALVVELQRGGTKTASVSSANETNITAKSITTPNQQTLSATANTYEVASTGHWDEIGSNDMPKLVANLKAAGFSDKMIGAIVSSLLREKYADRIHAAEGLTSDTPYWKSSDIFYSGDKRMKEAQKIYYEMNKEMRSSLGNMIYTFEEESLAYLQRQNGNLPATKLDKLLQIQDDYRELMSNYQTGGSTLPADKEKLKLLHKEQRADIEKLLTPEELFEYDLRNSPASWALRGWNDTFNLTEIEYRTLFPIYQKLEVQFPSDQGGPNDETMKARKAAEEQMQDQIKSLLGDERYAEYKQSRDQSARQENRLVLRLGMSLTTAAQLVDEKKSFQEQTKAIAKDKELTDDQKKLKLAAVSQAAQDRVQQLIGERGLIIYRTYGGGWLRKPGE